MYVCVIVTRAWRYYKRGAKPLQFCLLTREGNKSQPRDLDVTLADVGDLKGNEFSNDSYHTIVDEFHFRFWRLNSPTSACRIIYQILPASMSCNSDGSVTNSFAFWDGVRRMPCVCFFLRHSIESMVWSSRTECLFQNSAALQSSSRKYRVVQNIRKAGNYRNGKMYIELIKVYTNYSHHI